MPAVAVQGIGYGMGKKDFLAANCVRAFLGEAAETANGDILELTCNLDDMTPEALAFACSKVLVPTPTPTARTAMAGMGPKLWAKWVSRAAPVGVHSSPWTAPP